MFFIKKAYTQINKFKIRKVYRERKKKKRKKNYRTYVFIFATILSFILLYFTYNLFSQSYKQRINIKIKLNLKLDLNFAHSSEHLYGKTHEINNSNQYEILQLIQRLLEESCNRRQVLEKDRTKEVISKIKVISNFLLYVLLFLSWHKAMNLNFNNSANDNQFNPTALRIKREKLELLQKVSATPEKSSITELFDFLTPKPTDRNDLNKELSSTAENPVVDILRFNSTESDSKKKRTRGTKYDKERSHKEKKTRKTRSDKGIARGPSKKVIFKKRKKQVTNSALAALQKRDFEYHANLHSQTENSNSLKSTEINSINIISEKKNAEKTSQANAENVDLNLNLVFDEDLTKSIEALSQITPKKSQCSSTPSLMKRNSEKAAMSASSLKPPKQQNTTTINAPNINPRSTQPVGTTLANRQSGSFVPPANTTATKNQLSSKTAFNPPTNDASASANNLDSNLNLNATNKYNDSKYNNNRSEASNSKDWQNDRIEHNSNNDYEFSNEENDHSISTSDDEKKERILNNKKDDLPLFSPRRAARKNQSIQNNPKPKSGPTVKIVFISEQYKNSINENDKNLIDYIKNNCEIEDFAVDKKRNLLLYTKSEEAANAIVSNQNFFNNEQKINLGREKNPLLISNITLEAIDQSDALQNTLKSLGIIGYDKVTRNQKDDSGLVKAYCDTREKRLEILERRYLSVRTNKWRFELEFKPLLWTPDRCKFCHVLKRHHPNITCSEENERCAKCAKKHKTAECTVHYSRYACVNCDGSNNNRHSALDQRRCPQLKKWKKDATAKEMKRLREEVGKPPSVFYTDADSRSYSTVGGVKDEIYDINKKLKSIEKSIKDSQNNTNDALLSQFKILLDQNASNITKTIEKSSNQKFLEFRKMHNQEIDNKIKESEYRVTKNILNIMGQNDKLKMLNEPEKYDFENYFAQKFGQEENDNAMNFENSTTGSNFSGAL
jgi:hypothetical protein